MIKIYNRNNFLLGGIPNLHPESQKYINYWKEQKKRCIEGFWAQDTQDKEFTGAWRWMPSNLYFYVNFCTILHQDEKGPKAAPKKRMRPYLRDIEWEFFYNWIEARGFSGFAGDDQYSCNVEIKEHLDGLTPPPQDPSCYKPDGSLKDFVEARSYLRELYSEPMGLPLYNNQAKNLFMLGSRGFGKSYMVGGGVILHEWLFDGAKVYDEESIHNPAQVEIFVGAALSSKSADLLQKFRMSYEELPGVWAQGTLEEMPAPFFKAHSGSLQPNNMKNPWTSQYEKKVAGRWQQYGSGSMLKHGIYTVENPEAAAGSRPGVMVIEEVGLLPNVLKVHGSNDAAQREGADKFGSAVYLGTGGNMEKIVEAEIIFRSPISYDFLAFDDEWENRGKLGWFVPAYYALNQFKDENGNTDIKAATEHLMRKREGKLHNNTTDAYEYEQMNYPIKPSEMFIKASGSFFPKEDLEHRLGDLETDIIQLNASWKSRFVINKDNGKSKYLNTDKMPIRLFPLGRDANMDGCVEIFEHPKRTQEGLIPFGRYVAGIDPVDDDDNRDTTLSLQSTIVFDSWTDRIVAEYTSRTYLAEEYYEQVRRLLMYFNAIANYEQQKKGIYAYFKNKNSTYLLCETPMILSDKDLATIKAVGNRKFGTYASEGVNTWARELIKTWLMRQAYGKEEGVTNVETIRSPAMLKELIAWDGDINADRVSALGMCMILREDFLPRIDQSKSQAKKGSKTDFWDDNYNKFKNKSKRKHELWHQPII